MNTLAAILATLRRATGSITGAVGFTIFVLVILAALFAPVIATHDPDALDVMNRFAPPSAAHWLGTDHLGRDLFSRLIHGATIAMSVALSAIALALAAGTVLGILAAYLSDRGERVILILFDVIAAFPSLVLALAIVAVFGPSTGVVVAIVALTMTPHFGRVARAQVLTLKNAPFLEAERILGASGARIVFVHLLPNIMGPLVVLASMDIPVVITIEAGLSFLGLGVRPPLASWGTLIQDGYQFLSDSWIPVVVSSLALALATLGFTLFGEALRDAVDPRIGRER
ncbi:peptide ABC transporter permease [Prosthecomicrobium hirschii]|uniref:Peptide ABC transporter permease n=1 Tax=Prosthecodimorpha hirschii TaxID=665126 RepID=A0A0P6VUU3_9HYPH|nr:ABC transporter permease [Prosthecomicrobium hirschii]KPL55023.1 peptide ABC transporter permease [Prosthecomicrobium hirschii]